MIGFYIASGFVVLSVAAGYLMRERFVPEARRMLSTTLWLLLLFVPLQIWLGDASGLVTEQLPAGQAGRDRGTLDTQSRMPLTLFAVPDQDAAVNHDAIDIPLLGSLILTHDPNGSVVGLNEFPRADWPPVAIVFFGFRIMVGIGFLMLAVVLAGNLLRRADRMWRSRVFLRVCQWGAPLGFIAVIAGWVTTEVGRQPWTVYGLLRTADSVTPSLTGWNVAVSLAGYIIAYAIIYPAGLVVMARLVRRGPSEAEHETTIEGGRPRSPVRPVSDAQGQPT